MSLKPICPPVSHTANGDVRRVGVELEFAGPELEELSPLVVDLFGGRVVKKSAHRHVVKDGRWGDFVVELDTRFAHPDERLKEIVESAPDDWLAEGIRSAVDMEARAKEVLGDVLTGIVPTEIVCPPLPWDKLPELDRLFEGLRELDAKGTNANPIYGFGLHLNAEIPDSDVSSILAHLRAFLVLAPWLREKSLADLTRRILPYANPFPRRYIVQIFDPKYDPDLKQLIADYAIANPTRNRELDLYPLFAFLAEDEVAKYVDDPRIKARPTYHYRLPDARLSDPDWSAVTEWNLWVGVERLAADEEKLREGMELFVDQNDQSPLVRWFDDLWGKLSE